MKAAQTNANEKKSTSQAKSDIQENIIQTIIIDKGDGTIEEKINTKAEITNKEAEEAEETEEEMMGIPEGGIFNQRQSSKIGTVDCVDGKQTTKAPNVSDVRKVILQVRPVPIRIMLAIVIKDGTDVPGGVH